jgi:hemerythrin superfamily protein
MPDPIAMLEQDHRKVESLFSQWQQSKDASVAQQICMELTVHATVEEQSIYPVLAQDVPEGEQLEEEAEQEHAEAKQLIATIEQAGFEGPQVDEAMETLISAVTHHVEEEESEIFPKMQRSLDKDVLDTLGAEVDRLKRETMDQVAATSSKRIDLTTVETNQMQAAD